MLDGKGGSGFQTKRELLKGKQSMLTLTALSKQIQYGHHHDYCAAKALGHQIRPTLTRRDKMVERAWLCPQVAVRPEGANHQWRKNPPESCRLIR